MLTVTQADAEINGARLSLSHRTGGGALKIGSPARYSPARLTSRIRLTLLIELLLVGMLVGTVLLWNHLRQRTTRLQREHRQSRSHNRNVEIRLHAEQALAIAVLFVLFYEIVLMLGIGVMAIPGKVPLGIELLLQPSFAIIKFLLVTLITFLLRSLTTFLLSQWAADIDVAGFHLARRQQRYRSLVRVIHRFIQAAGFVLVAIWVLVDIPGVRATSASFILVGSALLGALAFVFQGFLRDFFAGLVMLLVDRSAIGECVEVDGIEGEVVVVGLFSTEIRCLINA